MNTSNRFGFCWTKTKLDNPNYFGLSLGTRQPMRCACPCSPFTNHRPPCSTCAVSQRWSCARWPVDHMFTLAMVLAGLGCRRPLRRAQRAVHTRAAGRVGACMRRSVWAMSASDTARPQPIAAASRLRLRLGLDVRV